MSIRPRFKLRTLVGAVALPAILLGALGEWNEVRERDFYASQERFFLDQGPDMEKLASQCRARAQSGPFDPSEPSWVELDRIYNFTRERVSDWDVAAAFFSKIAAGTHQTASFHSALKKQHQRRLLFQH